MKCPDCGTELTPVKLGQAGAYRCFKCGGFWVDSNLVNGLTSQSLAAWNRISADPAWFSGGSGLCPLDGTKFFRYSGESVPPNLVVLRCSRCGKWWFGGDSLFEFKPAQEARVNYFRLWGIGTNYAGIGLPVLVAAILLAGMAAGVYLVSIRQDLWVWAMELIR